MSTGYALDENWVNIVMKNSRLFFAWDGLSQPLLTLLHLTVCYIEQNATINFCLANDDSWQIADLTHTHSFGQFSQLLNSPSKLMCVSFFLFFSSICETEKQSSPSRPVEFPLDRVNCMQRRTTWRRKESLINWAVLLRLKWRMMTTK